MTGRQRQILTHLTRNAFAAVLPQAKLELLYDVSHNTCKVEEHEVGAQRRRLFVHRKGATRAFGPGHPDLPSVFQSTAPIASSWLITPVMISSPAPSSRSMLG